MQVKNNVVVGMLIGLVLPLLAWIFSEVFFQRDIIANKPGVPYLVAVAINLILLKFIYKSNADKAGIGLLIVTFTAVILTFVFKIKLH
jgi:hypothetical protein